MHIGDRKDVIAAEHRTCAPFSPFGLLTLFRTTSDALVYAFLYRDTDYLTRLARYHTYYRMRFCGAVPTTYLTVGRTRLAVDKWDDAPSQLQRRDNATRGIPTPTLYHLPDAQHPPPRLHPPTQRATIQHHLHILTAYQPPTVALRYRRGALHTSRGARA